MMEGKVLHFSFFFYPLKIQLSLYCNLLCMRSVIDFKMYGQRYSENQRSIPGWWCRHWRCTEKCKVSTPPLLQVMVDLHSNKIPNVESCWLCRLFGNETKNKLPLGEFLTAVGQLKFRGTSVLFRLPQSCVASLKGSVG